MAAGRVNYGDWYWVTLSLRRKCLMLATSSIIRRKPYRERLKRSAGCIIWSWDENSLNIHTDNHGQAQVCINIFIMGFFLLKMAAILDFWVANNRIVFNYWPKKRIHANFGACVTKWTIHALIDLPHYLARPQCQEDRKTWSVFMLTVSLVDVQLFQSNKCSAVGAILQGNWPMLDARGGCGCDQWIVNVTEIGDPFDSVQDRFPPLY